MNANRSNVLTLYKQLVRYGRTLQLTDKDYYFNRIRGEFHANRTLESTEEIQKLITVCTVLEAQYSSTLLNRLLLLYV